jgi:hypothetical protein
MLIDCGLDHVQPLRGTKYFQRMPRQVSSEPEM